MKILTYHRQVIDEIYPIIIPNQISTISMQIPSLVKIHWHSFKLSFRNENTDARTDRQMDTRTAKVIPQYTAIIVWRGIIPREQALKKNLRSKRGPFGLHIHIHTMPYTHPHSPSTPAIYCVKGYTVDSRYLEFQGTLWNTSRYPYFDISDLRNWGKQLIEQPPLPEWICNLTLS